MATGTGRSSRDPRPAGYRDSSDPQRLASGGLGSRSGSVGGEVEEGQPVGDGVAVAESPRDVASADGGALGKGPGHGREDLVVAGGTTHDDHRPWLLPQGPQAAGDVAADQLDLEPH